MTTHMKAIPTIPSPTTTNLVLLSTAILKQIGRTDYTASYVTTLPLAAYAVLAASTYNSARQQKEDAL